MKDRSLEAQLVQTMGPKMLSTAMQVLNVQFNRVVETFGAGDESVAVSRMGADLMGEVAQLVQRTIARLTAPPPADDVDAAAQFLTQYEALVRQLADIHGELERYRLDGRLPGAVGRAVRDLPSPAYLFEQVRDAQRACTNHRAAPGEADDA